MISILKRMVLFVSLSLTCRPGSNLTAEMSKVQGHLCSVEAEVQRLRREARASSSHASGLEQRLQGAQGLLRTQTQLGTASAKTL